ncbi:MAG: SpaH/EbpB family LPXTG-anchored major pilin [Clostridia bacterium]|nr:SpaH/EbpB family LPXTG-anchored major pilin [Clostridia bacterium]
MKITKVLSILMVIAMLLSVATVAFADPTTGSITVKAASDNEDYTIYKLFDLTYSGNNYSYTLDDNSPWKAFFTTGAGNQYVTVDANNNVVTWTEGKAAADLAAAAIAYAKGDDAIKAAGTTKTGAGADLVFDNLTFGYYLVDSTLGALCALNTNAADVDVDEKNVEPTITKEVQEDSNNAWETQNDAAIGETVNFKATINIGKGAELLTMHDEMDDGLTYGSVTQITLNGQPVAEANYTVKSGADCDDDCDFEIVFAKDYITSLAENSALVVEYTATVNENAVIRGTGNQNTAKLQYGEKPNFTEDTTTTYVWDFDVFKYTGNEKTPLAGATFTLSASGTPLKFTEIEENKYKLDKNGAVTSFTTDATGTIKFIGLDSGTYQLTETVAPTGYNKLGAPINVTIANTGVVTPAEIDNTVQVENKTGSELPDTGSIGTIIFYVIGGVLFVAALVLLITKKRMGQAQ